jgi:hypothetical protein
MFLGRLERSESVNQAMIQGTKQSLLRRVAFRRGEEPAFAWVHCRASGRSKLGTYLAFSGCVVTVECKLSIRAAVHLSSFSFRSPICLSSAAIRARSAAPAVTEWYTAPETPPTMYTSTRMAIRFMI